MFLTVLLALLSFAFPSVPAHADPPCPSYVSSLPPAANYKTQRLREMADTWRCTVLEDRTVPLLAMLLTEDGTLTAERRADCHGGVCYAVGLQGHNICRRGGLLGTASEGMTFCTWKDGKSPLQQFEEMHPRFSTEWQIQFAYYTSLVRGMTLDGSSVDDIIRSWNSREKGRREKVRANEATVREALGI
jgi:hypothetical protein